jgi:hypothetical protein
MNKLAIAAVATAALGAAATSPAYAGINMRFLGRLFPLGANAMHVSFAKLARAVTLLAAGILASASSGWVNPAVAQTFRVDVSGTFTSGTPFAVSFMVNTNAAPVLHQNAQGLALVGYADAAISGFSVTADGVPFAQSDIQDRIAVANAPGAAVFFSQDLANGAAPSIWMFLQNGNGELEIGDVSCGFVSAPCQFTNLLEFKNSGPPGREDDGILGIVSVQITGYAGTPGVPNCHGKSVSALSKQFGTLSAAADTLGFASVNALGNAITMFCGN